MGKLTISGYAAAKIAAFSAYADTETSGFGVFNDKNQVVDFRMVQHEATAASIEFDEDSQDEYLIDQVSKGNKRLITNLWWHTHPCGPTPSGVDEKMFAEMREGLSVGIMLIYGNDGKFSCRLAVTSDGFTASEQLTVVVDHTIPWGDETLSDWKGQITELCTKKAPVRTVYKGYQGKGYTSPQTSLPLLDEPPDTTFNELEAEYNSTLFPANDVQSAAISDAWDQAMFSTDVYLTDDSEYKVWYKMAWAVIRRPEYAEWICDGQAELCLDVAAS